MQQHNPPHPGGFIKRVYLEAKGIRFNVVAQKLHVHPSTFNRLINEKSRISPVMALKLSKVFGRSPESWLSMQKSYDLWETRNKINLWHYEAITF